MDKSIFQVHCEDCKATMARIDPDSVHLVVTSPPYLGCRQYGNETVGREANPREYVENLRLIADGVKRILHPKGSFYLNIGDVYFGSKGFSRNAGTWARKTDKHYKEHKFCKGDGKYLQEKQLLLLPTRVAAAMQDDGWILRNDLIWVKPNPLPADARDRRLPCYEHIFHFVKSRKYFFRKDKAKELKSNRDVIRQVTKPFKDHPAAFTEALIEPLVLTTSKKGDIVYDPFMGSGTTAVVAIRHGRRFIGSEINPDYVDICNKNIAEIKQLTNYDQLSFVLEPEKWDDDEEIEESETTPQEPVEPQDDETPVPEAKVQEIMENSTIDTLRKQLTGWE